MSLFEPRMEELIPLYHEAVGKVPSAMKATRW